jgi:hypothetical protein
VRDDVVPVAFLPHDERVGSNGDSSQEKGTQMSATITLDTPRQSHLRTRLLAAGAVVAIAAGATALIINAQDDAPAKPAPAVQVAPESHAHPGIGSRPALQSDNVQQQLTLHNSRR